VAAIFSPSSTLETERQRLVTALFTGFYFVALLWLVKIAELGFEWKRLYEFGLLPREWQGLPGIITSPFVHGGFNHLFNNSVPLLFAIAGIIYFFPKAALRSLIFIYLATNSLVWIFGRESYHIGASGLVYGYMSFLFFGSAFARNRNMMVVSLVIIFVYGAMFWGIFPQGGNISWESHLFGAVTGLAFAFLFRRHAMKDPAEPVEEEDDDEDDEAVTTDNNPGEDIKISYFRSPFDPNP
jgi:membrane associated rhomboid family serine protease